MMKTIYRYLLLFCFAFTAVFSLSSFGSVPVSESAPTTERVESTEGRSPKAKKEQRKRDAPQKNPKNTLGKLALIFSLTAIGLYGVGILLNLLHVSLVSSLLWLFLGLPMIIAAIILGAMGVKRDEKPGMARAGMIIGIVFVALMALLFVLSLILLAVAFGIGW